MNDTSERRLTERNPWKWVLAVLLAVISHSVWLFGLHTSWAIPRATVSEPTQWTFVTLPEDPDAHPLTDILDVWSPSVFALPTRLGFSRALVTEEIRLRPPLQSPPETTMLLDRALVESAADPAIDLPTWEQLRRQLDAQVLRVPVPPAHASVERPARPPAPVVASIEGAGARDPERIIWTEDADLWGTAAWSAELLIHVDSWGAVTRVVLDRRTADDKVNEELVRQAHGWRWAPADGSDIAHAHVIYYGTPNEDPKEGEAP